MFSRSCTYAARNLEMLIQTRVVRICVQKLLASLATMISPLSFLFLPSVNEIQRDLIIARGKAVLECEKASEASNEISNSGEKKDNIYLLDEDKPDAK